MRITHVQLKNFRCFTSFELELDHPIILLEGLNGTGKTSLLEALHYICYLRSFRTHSPQELVQFGSDTFFIKARVNADQNESYDLQVGFGNKKRLVKINEKAVSTYKELLDYYRIITLNEDDLLLIKEGPDLRRLFIDQAIILSSPEHAAASRRLRDVLDNRNALLKRGGSQESYQLWTEQLWQLSAHISSVRVQALEVLEREIKELIARYFNSSFEIQFTYQPKKNYQASFQEFMDSNPDLYHNEMRFCRSLFGSHLDDFSIRFKEVSSRNFASRGQQKLIILLLKAAQVKSLQALKGQCVLLLDDFMTDFDHDKVRHLITLLTDLGIQLIFTVPTLQGVLHEELLARGARLAKVTS
ncbi:DNA replication/repair protein RecF [soil metagenome]